MWPTWLAVHGVRRYRCAPKAACPNLVITRPHTGHRGAFMPRRSNNQLQQELTRSTTPKSFLEADTSGPTTQGLAPANDGSTHARSAFNRCVKPVASYLWSSSVCRESHCVIMRYQHTSISIQRIAVIHPDNPSVICALFLFVKSMVVPARWQLYCVSTHFITPCLSRAARLKGVGTELV